MRPKWGVDVAKTHTEDVGIKRRGAEGANALNRDVIGILAVAFEEDIGFADRVAFGRGFFAVNVGDDLFAAFVVKDVGAGGDFFGDGQKHEVGHEFDGVTGRPVFAGFLVVFLVEFADRLLEDGAHGVVVNARGAEVAFGFEEFGDESAEGVGYQV